MRLSYLAFALVWLSLASAPAGARQVVQKRARVLEPPAIGADVAPVTIERFCDYAQSPCASVDDSLGQLVARHPGEVRVVFRTHRMRHVAVSDALAQAVWEAHAQGRFFAFRDAVFAARPSDRYAFALLAGRAGLDVDGMNRALADGRHAARVEDDDAWAGRFGVDATPALVWNGKRAPLPVGRLEAYEQLYAAAHADAEARLRAGVSPSRLYATLVRDAIRARAAEIVRAGAAVAGDTAAPPSSHRVNVPTAGAPVRGDVRAEVRIVVFGDYQCPHSRALSSTLARLEEAYPGHVAIVWKHAPLDAHPDARLAARGAVCAQRQGQFWELHARLYAPGYRIDREQLLEHAAQLGLDVDRFARELDDGSCVDRLFVVLG
jgi:protein-disulfide isomerase